MELPRGPNHNTRWSVIVMAENQPTHNEVWRPVRGHEATYEVSNHGRVRSVDRTITDKHGNRRRHSGRVLKLATSPTGHLKVNLGLDNPAKLVHRIVLEAFVGPAPEKHECCHRDGNPANNHLENLRWDTRAENNFDRVRHGTHNNASKTHCSRGHRLDLANLVPSTLKRGGRNCLACSRARAHIHRHPHLKVEYQRLADEYYQAILN